VTVLPQQSLVARGGDRHGAHARGADRGDRRARARRGLQRDNRADAQGQQPVALGRGDALPVECPAPRGRLRTTRIDRTNS